MRLFCVVFFIVSLARSSRVQYDVGDESSGSDEENINYVPHVETTLDFRGLVRKLFVLELGLNLKNDNIICSPISALMPLAKLVYGAKKKSKTETELLEAVGLRDRTAVKYEYNTIIKQLEYLKGVDISLVSRLYVSRQHTLMPRFVAKAQSVFGSGIEVMDFSKPKSAAKKINNWFREHTGNKITDVIKPSHITTRVSLILANAIHFKGSWEYPFRPAREGIFYGRDGITSADLMTKSGSYNYVRCDELNAQVIEIPYKGGDCAMVIVLPYSRKGLPILLRTLKLSPGILNRAMMKMKTTLVEVTIPKFKIETTVDLLSMYKKMGVKYSMDMYKSDLTNIVRGEKLYISSAVHKAIIDVSEKGTFAAAATGVQVTLYNLMLPDIHFKATRPFLFYIKFNHEQIFAGIVTSP